jgi:glycosyltransferase involved in cell wall biosynthesis
MTAPPLILSVFPSFAVGGAQVRFAALANRWGDRWRHGIISLDGRTGCAERLGPQVAVSLLPADAMRGNAATRLLAIHTLLRRLRPAALLTSNWGSIEWAAAALAVPRLRHVHTEDGFGPDEATRQKWRRVVARGLLLRRAEIALPSTLLFGIARDCWRLPERRLHHIPNGLDLRRFHPGGLAPALLPPGEGPVIGTVAALRPEKNIARLLCAAARLRAEGVALRLLIIGDGAERAALETRAAALGLAGCTRFAGHLPDPSGSYAAMDVFALASDTEQMPFSVMEAMASALPVAATEVGDLRAMLSAANLPYLAARDDAALAAALRPLLGDAGLRARIGAANRAKAEEDYDEEVMFARYAALIDGGPSLLPR